MLSCARMGTPTGGPRDSIPPILIKAIPEMETIHFKEEKIKIYFDEYIKLDKVNEQLIISPPQKNDPEIFPQGSASKFISIKILDTLDQNTTYSFNFGNSIVDNNEGNELGNFKYVFSTGDYIDSLKVAGEINDPMVKDFAKDIDVMLYEYDSLYTDSVIFKQKPRYIANTLDSTLYELTNLRAGKYLLIALRDNDNNKIYNPENDKIGFVKDTISIPTDNTYNISIFKEISELKLFKPKELKKGHLVFGYNGKFKNFKIDVTSDVPYDFRSELTFEEEMDTVNYWYTEVAADSLNFTVTADSITEHFTARIRSTEIDSLISAPSAGSTLHLLDTFSIQTNTPIIRIDSSLISLVDQDTLNVPFRAYLAASKTKLFIEFEKEQENLYKMNILPKMYTDIYGISNDSMSYQLTTKTIEDYGVLNIDVRSTSNAGYIVELLGPSENVVRRKKILKPETVSFEYLNPGKYFVRAVIDENKNGIWDTGSVLEKRQPESIKYLGKEIEIRANWEENEIFNIDE